jgi:serine protease AprX
MSLAAGRSVGRSGLRRRVTAVVASALLASLLLVPGTTLAADPYNPATDMGSMLNATSYTGARLWWAAGYTGAGVDVAVIDSGVAPVPGLDAPGKIVDGPDLSFESQADNLRYLDTFGHGTHMAGIIAGRGRTAGTGPQYAMDTTSFLGVAPDARIVSIKVATADGATDVSQVIAAIDWVVQHRNDNGLNIRVLNLSFGTDSVQDYEVDPLAFAVEQAWKAGIFVVAATGNDGFAFHTGTLTNPAFDPKIFAVGASDPTDTFLPFDDRVADFSSTGSTSRYVDVVAPGSHVVSLRVPGSFIDQEYGSTGYVTDTLFRGSGTSQAAAFVSGAAALAIQKYPSISPDYLKKLFLGNTHILDGFSSRRQGAGEVDLASMLVARLVNPSKSWNRIAWSTGTGSLDLARGSAFVSDGGVDLRGEQDIFGHDFDSAAMAAAEAAGNSWSGGTWNGNAWAGAGWTGMRWSGMRWSGDAWTGMRWSGMRWSDNTWSGMRWSGDTWSGMRWSGMRWSDGAWSTGSWD